MSLVCTLLFLENYTFLAILAKEDIFKYFTDGNCERQNLSQETCTNDAIQWPAHLSLLISSEFTRTDTNSHVQPMHGFIIIHIAFFPLDRISTNVCPENILQRSLNKPSSSTELRFHTGTLKIQPVFLRALSKCFLNSRTCLYGGLTVGPQWIVPHWGHLALLPEKGKQAKTWSGVWKFSTLRWEAFQFFHASQR